MTTFDPASGLHLPHADTELPQRMKRLHELGLGTEDPDFDRYAADLAREASGPYAEPYAMVNLITDKQHFAGLHIPSSSGNTTSLNAPPPAPVGRSMPLDHGFCPDVLHRRKPLVLPDVYASPRFASNQVVDQIGIRTYAGAPLIDETTGITLGTVCFVGTEQRPREAGRDAWDLIRAHRDRVMQHIYRRASIR
jgi:GAF domain-containing protein